MATEKPNVSIADEWLEEDNLELLECWARDGYTLMDIANRIGIGRTTLDSWRKKYPEIRNALKKGKEIVDYKVENALLKSALGYKTKEVKVTTLMRYGKVIETTKEATEKDQAPNVSACQVWLYNRLPNKWKRNRDNLIELDDEDTTIQVTVTRANSNQSNDVTKSQPEQQSDNEVDEEWQDKVNTSIEISKKKDQEETNDSKSKTKSNSNKAQKESSKESDDLDYWPDDWEDE